MKETTWLLLMKKSPRAVAQVGRNDGPLKPGVYNLPLECHWKTHCHETMIGECDAQNLHEEAAVSFCVHHEERGTRLSLGASRDPTLLPGMPSVKWGMLGNGPFFDYHVMNTPTLIKSFLCLLQIASVP